jgi:hypothetical protein
MQQNGETYKLIPVCDGITIKVASDFYEKYWGSNYRLHAKSIQIYDVSTTREQRKRGVRTGGWKFLHRFVMGLKLGDLRQVHHMNHDKFDFRYENLKIVTVEEHKTYHPNKHALRYFHAAPRYGYNGLPYLGYGTDLESAIEKHRKVMALLELHKEEIGYTFYGNNGGS